MIEKVLWETKDIHSVSIKEGNLLYNLSKNCSSKGVIVEIGSWKGYSTLWLAKGSKEGNNVPIYAIDPHTGASIHKEMYGEINTYNTFIENITKAGVKDIIKPLVMTSVEAEEQWKSRNIALLFIDGDHKVADVDFKIWCSHLIDGGIVALHDTTTWEVPRKVAIDCIYKSSNFVNIKRVGSITYARNELCLTPMMQELVRKANQSSLRKRKMYQTVLPYYNRGLGLVAKIIGRG